MPGRACVARRHAVLQPRNDRHRVVDDDQSSCRCWQRRADQPAQHGARRAGPDSREPDGEGGRRSRALGPRSETGGTAAVAAFGGTQARNRLRRVDRPAGVDGSAPRQSQPRTRVRLSADQNQDQTGQGRASSSKRSASGFPDITLSVDANSAYSLEPTSTLFKQLDAFDLLMIEQPLAPGDLVDHAKLQRGLETPICLDESSSTWPRGARHASWARAASSISSSAVSADTARRGHPAFRARAPGARVVRRDARSGHRPGAQHRPLDAARLHAARRCLRFPRYWDEDIVEPPVTVSRAGTITAPAGHGIGLEVNEAFVDTLTVRRETVRLGG